MRFVFILAILFCAGCNRPGVDDRTDDTSENVDFELTSSLRKIQVEFKKLDKEDQDLFYKQIAGSALYIKNAKKLNKSSDFYPILLKVQSSYMWEVDKYPRFTDAISDYLIEEGYDEPRELSTQRDRAWLYNIFNSIYMAIKYE
jgi:hypothetical protein